MNLLEDDSILSWIIRGFLGKQSRFHVCDIINYYHSFLVILYETYGGENMFFLVII
jgi:hypothetical protein